MKGATGARGAAAAACTFWFAVWLPPPPPPSRAGTAVRRLKRNDHYVNGVYRARFVA